MNPSSSADCPIDSAIKAKKDRPCSSISSCDNCGRMAFTKGSTHMAPIVAAIHKQKPVREKTRCAIAVSYLPLIWWGSKQRSRSAVAAYRIFGAGR